LKIVGRKRGRPGRGGGFFRAIESKDAMGAADLRLTEGCGFGFAEGAEFAGAAMDNIDRKL